MNKNLKRALNTTAAVSMSLAMVLGAVNPMDVDAALSTVCTSTDESIAKDILATIKADLKAASKKHTELKVTDTVAWTNLDALLATNGGTSVATSTIDAMLATSFNGTETVKEYLDKYVKCGGDDELASFLVGADGVANDTFAQLVGAFETAISNLYDAFEAGSGVMKDGVITKAEYNSTAKNLYKALTDGKKYLGNITEDANANKTEEVFETYFQEFEDAVKEYQGTFVGDFAEDFVENVFEVESVAGVSIDALVNRDDTPFDAENVEDLEDFIKDIKDGEYDEQAGVKYEDVKEEEEVVEYMDVLQEIVDNCKKVNDLLKTTNPVYKEFKKLVATSTGKVKALANAINALDPTQQATQDTVDIAVTAFRGEDVEALKAYVEEVYNEFYTVRAVERSNGNVSLVEDETELTRFLPAGYSFNNDLITILYTNVEKTSEESYYDLLVEDESDIDAAVKAVTKDIADLTFNTSLTDKEANKIVKAKKALNLLTINSNGNVVVRTDLGLTTKERREIKDNIELINVLYTKLLYTGIVKTTGWVQDSQGRWEYYDNNGNRVYEGWAPGNGYWSYMKNGYSVANEWCAAKNNEWYYMGADGKMVTGKVTIDGVEQDFGTDGIWVRK